MASSNLVGSLSQVYRSYMSPNKRLGESSYYDGNAVFDYRDGDASSTSLIDRGGYGSDGDDCCPLVVDPLSFLAVVTLIGIGTYCLNVYITRNQAAILAAAGGKKRSFQDGTSIKSISWFDPLADIFWHGESM